MFEFVNVTNYRGFCFRGEGGANFVVSAKHKVTDERIVWRLAKHKKSGHVSIKPKCHITNAYMENLIAPLIPSQFLIQPKMVLLPLQHVHHLAKLLTLRSSAQVEAFDELVSDPQYALVQSSLPMNDCATALSQKIRYIAALEMQDATCIPKRLATLAGPTITVELKPKQGFFQQHAGVNVPYCNNCVMQIEKWKSAAFEKMYDFCPMDLFSGDLERMQKAVTSLIRDPHRNLRIFVDGNMIHSDEAILAEEKLVERLFPNHAGCNVATLAVALAQILADVTDDVSDFCLGPHSILRCLLDAQRIDPIGIVTAYQLYQNLTFNEQNRLHDKCRLMGKHFANFINKTDPVSLLERYFFAATFKDCSLMISLRLADHDEVFASGHLSASVVKLRTPEPLYFAYSTKIVDLDPKTPKNLVNAHQRFLDGVRIIQENPSIHPPCMCLAAEPASTD